MGVWRRRCPILEESLALRRELGDTRGTPSGSSPCASATSGAPARCQEEALALRQALDDAIGVAHARHSLGRVASLEGDPPAALAHHAEAVALARGFGGCGLPHLLHAHGEAALAAGDPATARASHAVVPQLFARAGERQGVPMGLEGLATVTAAAGAFAGRRASGGGHRATRGAPSPARARRARRYCHQETGGQRGGTPVARRAAIQASSAGWKRGGGGASR